jgi:hypothetical protein
MNAPRIGVYLLVISYLFSSCAASYKPINPSKLQYSQSDKNDTFQYKYDVLLWSNNKKFAKKELNTQIRIVAVKIYNGTGQTLKYGVNYKIYSDNKEVDILPIGEVTRHIRETVPTYFLYLLLTPTTLTTSSQTSSNRIPIGYFLGPALTVINVGVAAGANKHFREEMEEYNLAEKEILNGETAYGLIGIQSQDVAPLYMRVTGK